MSPDPSTSDRPAPRWRWARLLVPALLLLGWLAFGGVAGQYPGRLSEVQRNDASGFLPESAESTRVSQLQGAFEDDRTYPGFVVVEGTEPLTAAQSAAVQALADRIPGLEIEVDGSAPVRVGDFLAGPPSPVLPSEDGRAALLALGFRLDAVGSTLPDGESPVERAVEVIRAQEAGLETAGVEVYVSGPAGQLADLVAAFGGIDTRLLLVTLTSVLVILLLVYRSPFIPFFVILSSVFALTLASFVVYHLARNGVIDLDGQAQGILSILVVGAATDYALLLVARYREELRRHDDRFEAMRRAWRRTLEPVVASAGTVVVGLLCLLLSDLGQTRGLGPVGAIGIGSAVLAALTFLPALLVIPGRTSRGEHGRWVFWPRIPHVGSSGPEDRGVWARTARLVGARPRRVWVTTVLVLTGLAGLVPTFRAEGTTQADLFLTRVESVSGDEALARHFAAGSGNPSIVIGPAGAADAMLRTVRGTAGVSSASLTGPDPATDGAVEPPTVVDGRVQIEVTLDDPADSPAADRTVRLLREELDRVSPQALVGGSTAVNVDLRATAAADRNRIIPISLLVIFLVLALLLRAIVAPLLLLLANVLSFGATLGVAAVVFNHVLGLPGADPSVPLYGFVFLVALGIDYSIFLMTRVREESGIQGTRPGVLTGLAVTGGVITSAGIVLAATFTSLAVIPLLFLVQIAFIVAFGVLLDTFVVRSLLVPALVHDLGGRTWWPSRPDPAGRPGPGGEPEHPDPAGEPEARPDPVGAR